MGDLRARILNINTDNRPIGSLELMRPGNVDEVVQALRHPQTHDAADLARKALVDPKARYRVSLAIAPDLVAAWDTDKNGVITLPEVDRPGVSFRKASAGLTKRDLQLITSEALYDRLSGAPIPRDKIFERALAIYQNRETGCDDTTELLIDIADMAHTDQQRAQVINEAQRILYTYSGTPHLQIRALFAMAIAGASPEQTAQHLAAVTARESPAPGMETQYVRAIEARLTIDDSARARIVEGLVDEVRHHALGDANNYLRIAQLAAVSDADRKIVFDAAMKPSGNDWYRRDYSIAAAVATTPEQRSQVHEAAVAQMHAARPRHTQHGLEQAIAYRRTLAAVAMTEQDAEKRGDIARLALWHADQLTDHDVAVLSALRSAELAAR